MPSQFRLELELSEEGCCCSLQRALSEILLSEEIGSGRNRPTIPSMTYLPAGYLGEGIVRSDATSCIRTFTAGKIPFT